MKSISQLAIDLTSMGTDELIRKYSSVDFDSSIIPEIVEELLKQGHLDKLVDPDPKWDPGDCNAYLIKTGPSGYLYFQTERGGRLSQAEFDDLKAAVSWKLQNKFATYRSGAKDVEIENCLKAFEAEVCGRVTKYEYHQGKLICLVSFEAGLANPPDTNIFRLDIAGNVVWRIERFKEDSAGSATYYTDFWSDANDHWHAFHPLGLGFDCTFDINTGRIIKYEFMR